MPERTVRPAVVVELAPAFDHGSCFGEVPEPFAVEALIPELSVQAPMKPLRQSLPAE